MCTYICVQHFLRMKGLQHSHHNCMQPATLLQNAQCDASVGSCLNATLCCLPPCSNVRIWIRRPQQMEANQASLCAAEGLQIRGLHSRLPQWPRQNKAIKNGTPGALQQGERNESEIDTTCDASPSTFTTKTMDAAMSRSKVFKHLVLFDCI